MSSYISHLVPSITLNDSTEMPAIGLGTWDLRGEDAVASIRQAIEVGYRHIDTASIYGNEKEVGLAISQAIAAGDVTRDELFITSKVWNDAHRKEQVQQEFQKTLSNLGLNYLDCYMVHWPWPQQDLYVEAYEAVVELQGLGQLQSVGVANFYPEVLDKIIAATGVAPALNQVELHPGFSQAELRAYGQQHGIVLEAWSPLGRGKCLDNEVIVGIAQEVEKSPAQVALRWLTQLGVSVVPKSKNKQRQIENLDIFSFTLTDQQCEQITALDHSPAGGRLFESPLEFPGEIKKVQEETAGENN